MLKMKINSRTPYRMVRRYKNKYGWTFKKSIDKNKTLVSKEITSRPVVHDLIIRKSGHLKNWEKGGQVHYISYLNGFVIMVIDSKIYWKINCGFLF